MKVVYIIYNIDYVIYIFGEKINKDYGSGFMILCNS